VYDRRPQQLFEYLPDWSFKAYFRYVRAGPIARIEM
jgi:hypothetical protein